MPGLGDVSMVTRRQIPPAAAAARTRELDAIRLQRPLTAEERAEADNLAMRQYLRIHRAAARERDTRTVGEQREQRWAAVAARAREIDAIRLQRPLTAAEQAEADNLASRLYQRARRTAGRDCQRRRGSTPPDRQLQA